MDATHVVRRINTLHITAHVVGPHKSHVGGDFFVSSLEENERVMKRFDLIESVKITTSVVPASLGDIAPLRHYPVVPHPYKCKHTADIP